MYFLFVFSGNIIFDYNEVLPLRCGGVGCGNHMYDWEVNFDCKRFKWYSGNA